MGVSFTISKKGKIYRPQPKLAEEEVDTKEHHQDFLGDGAPSWVQTQNLNLNMNLQKGGDPTIVEGSSMHHSSALAKSFDLFKSTVEQLEALGPSVYLNLFLDGFTIGSTSEFFQYATAGSLYGYNIHTIWILSCVESGHLPVGVFDDMACKYVNGTVLCEVRDYRVPVGFPTIKRVPLKMGLQNIVKDISKMSDEFTHEDMLKFQSKVLRSLHPFLHLDPTTTADNIKETIPMAKIDLGIEWGRKSRKSNENLVGNETSEMEVLEHESTELVDEDPVEDYGEQQDVDDEAGDKVVA